MDGFQATQALMSKIAGKTLAKGPIIGCTAFSFESERKNSTEAGACSNQFPFRKSKKFYIQYMALKIISSY